MISLKNNLMIYNIQCYLVNLSTIKVVDTSIIKVKSNIFHIQKINNK